MNSPASSKLIIVSNRLPVTLTHQGGQWQFKKSSGGLVTALSSLQAGQSFLWVGWPGRDAPRTEHDFLKKRLHQDFDCQPVFLGRQEVNAYYNGFCNRVIWPLFHYLPNEMTFQESSWKAYQAVNVRFAEAVLEYAREGDTIWIHDFHLMLLPEILRQRMPSLKIGFFLHIPFPSSEVYRLLAVRQEILRGLLGADLIGFHSYDYLRHFSSSCLRLLGVDTEPKGIDLKSRRVRLGVFPIGIDPEHFMKTLDDPKCKTHMTKLQKAFAGRKIILGVDRMDYTKGIPLKLKAFEKFLEKNPDQRDKVLLYQVAVPSRMDVQSYQDLTLEVDELVGRINGRFGSIERSPIYYLNKSVSFEHLCALYATADMALLTPIRDGMNLVAQEYLLLSQEKKGVLILSEFTGAAHSLSGCILVNPWDTDQVVRGIEQVMVMSEDEKAKRFLPMYQFVCTNTARQWGRRFLNDLQQSATKTYPTALAARNISEVETELLSAYHEARQPLLFIDYDGTLRSICRTPSEAVPDKALLELLQAFANHDRVVFSLVSGRDRRDIEKWFGNCDIYLAAEHGFAYRSPKSDQWQENLAADLTWKPEVKKILEYFAERTPGALIEDKRASLSWHYRKADPDYGQWQADELLMHLEEILSHAPAEAIHGRKVIEIRPQGISKGSYVEQTLQTYPDADFILCMGDDETDEDMYRRLPPDAWICHVGSTRATAPFFTDGPDEVRRLLRLLLAKTE